MAHVNSVPKDEHGGRYLDTYEFPFNGGFAVVEDVLENINKQKSKTTDQQTNNKKIQSCK